MRETLEGLLGRARTDARRAEIEAELAVPPMPMALAYLWGAYFRIRRRCGGGGFRPLPITWPDIDAFVRHSGLRLAPWEVDVVGALDDLWLASVSRTSDADG